MDSAARLEKLELQLLVLRNAADAALVELGKLKSPTPRKRQNGSDTVARQMNLISTGQWRKPNKIIHNKKSPATNRAIQ